MPGALTGNFSKASAQTVEVCAFITSVPGPTLDDARLGRLQIDARNEATYAVVT